MSEPFLSDIYNDSVDRIMDFDDTELINSNNNFDFNSFHETKNMKDKNFMITYQENIDRINAEKTAIQNHLNNKIIELQTQIVKMKNTIERSEMSKAEVEVEVTKINKEFRLFQRQQNLKANEIEQSKMELTSHFKSLESDYINQISQLNTLNKMLQEQIGEEKRNYKNMQDTFNDKINQVTKKMKEKDQDLHNVRSLQLESENIIKDQKANLIDLTHKLRETEEINLRNATSIIEKDGKIETLTLSENKLKMIIVELNAKVNELESKHFEEKQELNDSRGYQNNLQSQVLELQQGKIMLEKERKFILDNVSNCNRRIKELEDCVNNQSKLCTNYREKIKKLENDKENQEYNISHTNENLQIKIEELESKLQIQSRVLEEVHDEISSSRENESVAVSNLNRTLEELERYICESSGNYLYMEKTSPRIKPKITGPMLYCQSPSKNSKTDNTEEFFKQSFDIEDPSPAKKIMKNIRQTISNFQDRINTLESDRSDALNKLESQGKEIKNLKFQLRRHQTQQKSLEVENNKKQEEIECLLSEISKVKSTTNVLRQENGKNISNLKQTLNKVSDEYQDNIDARDNYLQSISCIIKEALKNSLGIFNDRGSSLDNQGDMGRVLIPDYRSQNSNDPLNVIENSTQTSHLCDKIHKNDNMELTANLIGTFRFLKENGSEVPVTNESLFDKRTRYQPDNNNIDRKSNEVQLHNNVEEKKKSSMKRSIKKPENKADSDAYVDSCKSWPALREVISSELVNLLNKYDIQRAQYRTIPNDKFTVNCQQLISELSAKENLITRLLSNQNSNSAQAQVPVDSTSRYQQTNTNEQNIVNKSTNKATSCNQNNVLFKNGSDCKKKTKSVKVETAPSIQSKRCFKPENQKSSVIPRKPSRSSCAPTNKKAITMSPGVSRKPTGGQSSCKSTIGAQNPAVSTSCASRPTATSPRSMPPVTLRCPETADGCLDPNDDQVDSDCSLLPLFVGVLLRLVHTTFRLQATEEIVQSYKLCYRRSVDSSDILSLNNDLQVVINRSVESDPSVDNMRPKCRKFKVIVHVISACRHLSRKVLASKLFPQVDFNESNSFDFKPFLNLTLDQNVDQLCSMAKVDRLVESFSQFCVSNNYQGILLVEREKKFPSNNIIPISKNNSLICLKKNIEIVKSAFDSQVSRSQYSSKQKTYHMNLKNLLLKIQELGHIIEGQNSVIGMRDQDILRLQHLLSKECGEKKRLSNILTETDTCRQSAFNEVANNKQMLNKTKSYVSNMINLCEMLMKKEFFNFKELMKEEESIYQSLESTDCDDLLDSVRDGVRVALRLSGSVKSIIL